MSDRLTLCATTRLAQTLRGEAPDDVEVWQTRRALTVGQWLGSLADEALLGGIADLPTALDPFAERLLWEKIIAGSLTDAAPLFDIQGMAASATEAHALSRLWNIHPAGAQLADEARLFAGWQAEFDKRCRAAGWIDTISLQRQLIDLIAAGHFTLPTAVTFAGFDRLTPLEQGLMAALNGRGVRVENEPESAVNRAPPRQGLASRRRRRSLGLKCPWGVAVAKYCHAPTSRPNARPLRPGPARIWRPTRLAGSASSPPTWPASATGWNSCSTMRCTRR